MLIKFWPLALSITQVYDFATQVGGIMRPAGFFIVGLMLLVGGFLYGIEGVSVAPGTYCGNAFVSRDQNLTDTGIEACTAARSDRRPWTWALIGAGAVACVGAAALAFDGRDRSENWQSDVARHRGSVPNVDPSMPRGPAR